jgi:MFS transporter, DHA1 family, tetracycline resistance protein
MSRSPLLPIFLTVFVDVWGLTMLIPVLPFYGKHFGATPSLIGALLATYPAGQLFASPILGRLSDRWGRKRVLLASQMGTFVGFLILGSASSLWMLFLGRLIDGLTAGNLSIAQAYISDVTKPENRTKAFGLIGIAFGTGFLVSPFISGVLAKRFGYGAPALGAAALSFASILATAFLLPAKPVREGDEASKPEVAPQESRTAAFRRFFEQAAPRRRLLEFFCFTLSFSTLVGGLAMFLDQRFSFDEERVGYLFAFSGLIGAIIQGGIIGRLARRFGEEKLAAMGFAAMLLGYGLLGLAFTLPVLLGLTGVAAFGIAVTRPALTTLLTKSVGRDEQGAALGVSQSLTSVSQLACNLGAGFLVEARLLLVWSLVAGAFALVGLLLRLRPEPEAPAPAS